MSDDQAQGKLTRLKRWMKERLHVKTLTEKLADKRKEIEDTRQGLERGSSEEARLRQGLIDLQKLSDRPGQALELAKQLLKPEPKHSSGKDQGVANGLDRVADRLASPEARQEFASVKTFTSGQNGITELREEDGDRIVLKRAKPGEDFSASAAAQEVANYALLDRNDRPGRELFLTSYGHVEGVGPDKVEGLALEYVDGQTAHEFAGTMKRALNEGKITQSEYWGAMQFIAAEMLRAAQYLDEIGVAHADLKADNVKIGEDGRVRVLDLGTLTESKHGIQIPLSHAAPELVASPAERDLAKVDTYLVGGVVYQMGERGAFNLKSDRDANGMRQDVRPGQTKQVLADYAAQAEAYKASGESAIDVAPVPHGQGAVAERKRRISEASKLIETYMAYEVQPSGEHGAVAKAAADAAEKRRLQLIGLGDGLASLSGEWEDLLGDPRFPADAPKRVRVERDIDDLVENIYARTGSLRATGTPGNANAGASFPTSLHEQEDAYTRRLAGVQKVLASLEADRENVVQVSQRELSSGHLEKERLSERIDGLRAMIARAEKFAAIGGYHEATSLLYEGEARYAVRTGADGGPATPRPGEQGVETAYTRFLDELLAADPDTRLGADEGVPEVTSTNHYEIERQNPKERGKGDGLYTRRVSAIDTVQETGPEFVRSSQRLLSDIEARKVLSRILGGDDAPHQSGKAASQAAMRRQRIAATRVSEVMQLFKTVTRYVETAANTAIDVKEEPYKAQYKTAITLLRDAQADVKPGGDPARAIKASERVRAIVDGWWSKVPARDLQAVYQQTRDPVAQRITTLAQAIVAPRRALNMLSHVAAAKAEASTQLAYADTVRDLAAALQTCDDQMASLTVGGARSAKAALDQQVALQVLGASTSAVEAELDAFVHASNALMTEHADAIPVEIKYGKSS